MPFSYAETLKTLRAARLERDKAKSDLSQARLKQLRSLRHQRKADRKETVQDPASADLMASLREKIAAHSARLHEVEARLRDLKLKPQLQEGEHLLEALSAELAKLEETRVRVGLEPPRAAIAVNIKILQRKIDDLTKRLEELKKRLLEAGGQAGLEAEKARVEAEIEHLQKELKRAASSKPATEDQPAEVPAADGAIPRPKTVLEEKEKEVRRLIDELFQGRPPEKLIEEWDDATPIMLLPLRIETRFKEIDGKNQLWVRIFPDEIAVTTHEKILTDREQKHGVGYWTALHAARDEAGRKNAWQTLAERLGANRAAWVALQTKPSNWGVRHLDGGEGLKFPELPVTQPDSWTQAPHSVVMPDRFILMAYRNGERVRLDPGSQITDTLVVGPAPLEDDGNPSISRGAGQRLDLGEDFRWIADFPKALERGMAFRLELETGEGFDQLLVLGLKLSADEKDGQKLVEDLIDNHHYSAKGFSLIPQGTATNNTDGEASGFGTDDWLHDTSYFVETGNPLFRFEPEPRRASDGQRLAEYLGINYGPLHYISHSDGTDHAEAVAMNKSLYAGTLGYFLHSMLNEVMGNETIAKMRNLFTEHVTGRGPVSAIRVGSQPYGILLTSAFPRWSYPKERLAVDAFEPAVCRVLNHLQQKWQKFGDQLAHIGKPGNARQNLMNVLGLQPTSADYYHRVGYSMDYLRNLEDFQAGGRYLWDAILQLLANNTGRQFLRDFGYETQRENGTLKPVPLLFQLIYRHYHTRLDRQNLVTSEPLSEGPPYTDNRNYLRWLLANADDVDKLEKQDFGGLAKPNALLYLMLQNAVLNEARHAIHRLFAAHDIVADELVRSRKFMNISAQRDVSPWEVFRAPANQVIPAETSERPLLAFVQLERFTRGPESEIGAHFAEVKEALELLSKAPTARLERVFAEHIDTLNYRLDSWQTALFDRRLRAQRGLSGGARERGTGIYLGSYGYLENVRPMEEKRVPLSEDVLPPELREGRSNLYLQQRNGGYVHAPSLNHATAAAILRNGYLTHGSKEERDKLAVNLSSERVRRAKYLVDGVRNGQTLEALLGYLFERGLHDWTTRPVNPVILDQLKPLFRKAFPIKKTKIPRQGHASEPAEVIENYEVVNGLQLARTTDQFPYGVTGLSGLNAGQIDAIKKEKNNIENSLDALRDVLTAESAYQLAMGNFDRAGAVMESISSGELPVEVEVIRSSRGTDLSFTHRLAIQFDSGLSTNPWPAISLTLRARTEPGFNQWVGTLLGPPKNIRCLVRALKADGSVLTNAAGDSVESLVTLHDLGLQPLDFIYLIAKKIEATGYSELETRIRYHFAKSHSLGDATTVKIEFAKKDDAELKVRSFGEILPLADALRELAGKARPLRANDFTPASQTITISPDDPGNIDVAELGSRVAALRDEFDLVMGGLALAADNAETVQTEAALELLRQRLIDVANAGFVHAFPLSAVGFGQAEREALVAQARSLLARYDTLSTSYETNIAGLNGPWIKPPQKVTLLLELAKGFLGDEFRLLPKFSFWNTADLVQADANSDQLLGYARDTKQIPLPVDEWMHGVALVRPSVHTFQNALMLAETFGSDAGPCRPIQLPYQDNDTWLGLDFPDGTEIVHDTISLVQCLPQGFAPAGLQAGFLIDEWTESLPRKEEVTGIAFNYDQPNSAPPAAILLAVTPQQTGAWQWENLAATVLDTFARAKLRAVEPDMIETLDGFATLVPSTISEFSTGQNSISLDYSLNLRLIVQQLDALNATKGGG